MNHANGNRLRWNRRRYSNDFAKAVTRLFGPSCVVGFGLIYIIVSTFINMFIHYGKFVVIKHCIENDVHWNVIYILGIDAVINFGKAVGFIVRYL